MEDGAQLQLTKVPSLPVELKVPNRTKSKRWPSLLHPLHRSSPKPLLQPRVGEFPHLHQHQRQPSLRINLNLRATNNLSESTLRKAVTQEVNMEVRVDRGGMAQVVEEEGTVQGLICSLLLLPQGQDGVLALLLRRNLQVDGKDLCGCFLSLA